ncbi:MAG: DAK2 domain-containing protein [Chloroflexota bacterium]|nr:DAK2 domain-containing protein [Chloroflexota bacterium]
MTKPPALASLSGSELRAMFAAATAWLERHVEAINAINVFPVPDGDTGTNMYLTMRSTLEEAYRADDADVGVILGAMSKGALMGARGNSGVILSQIIRGLASAAQGWQHLDAPALAQGLAQGATTAYKAVSQPVEGTILTVMREAAAAAEGEARRDGRDILAVMASATEAAREAVANTPTLLPVLAEAGVVDAGGQGLYVMLEGSLRYLRGQEEMPAEPPVGREEIERDWITVTTQMHGIGGSLYGYCTECLVAGDGLVSEDIQRRMLELGDSVLVVGGDNLVRVHVHTDDPGAALSYCTALGRLNQVKVDNIQSQAEQFLAMHQRQTAAAAPVNIATVAVVAGEGMEQVFRSVGVSAIVKGGPTMNPSTRQLLEAIEGCPAEQVVLLPNDKNIVMAAEQALPLTAREVRVVKTTTVPQGVAALLAFSPDADLEANVEAMEEARASVHTVEVTRAIRTTSIRGLRIKEGQCVAVIDGELRVAQKSPAATVKAALGHLPLADLSLITLYYGADTREEEAQALAHELRRLHPQHDVEVVYGGQPHYYYIVSAE